MDLGSITGKQPHPNGSDRNRRAVQQHRETPAYCVDESVSHPDCGWRMVRRMVRTQLVVERIFGRWGKDSCCWSSFSAFSLTSDDLSWTSDDRSLTSDDRRGIGFGFCASFWISFCRGESGVCSSWTCGGAPRLLGRIRIRLEWTDKCVSERVRERVKERVLICRRQEFERRSK